MATKLFARSLLTFLAASLFASITAQGQDKPPKLFESEQLLQVRLSSPWQDIVRDDRDLRQIANEASEGRGRFFDALRKNYPARREFHNTTVVVPEPGGALVRKLLGIGFKVKGQRDEDDS